MPNDTPKLLRAIEVCLASRTKMSEMWKQGRDPLKVFGSCGWDSIPTARRLYERINQRAQRMFDGGLVEETQSLLKKYGATPRPLSRPRLQTGGSPDAGRDRT